MGFHERQNQGGSYGFGAIKITSSLFCYSLAHIFTLFQDSPLNQLVWSMIIISEAFLNHYEYKLLFSC